MTSLRTSLAGLTPRGRGVLAAGVALAAGALLVGQRDLLRVAVLLVVLPLAAVVVVARTRYRLACSRRLDPARVEAGRPSTVRLRLESVSRLPTGVLLLEDVLPYALGSRPRFVLDRVEPQAVRDVSYAVRAEVRGRYRVGPLAVRLTDPFGLVEMRRAFTAVDELVVTPVVSPLPAVRLGGDWSGGGETSARAVATGGTDDASTREYRQGDDLRKVHWRSTARTGELMVRREEQPFQSRATLLLDGRLTAHRGDGPASSFEWAVSAVASIGVSLLRSGFAVHLLRETGERVPDTGVPLTEGLLLDVLAGAQLTRTASLDAALDSVRGTGSGGVLVAVVGELDLESAEQLARLRTGSASGVVVALEAGSWALGAGRPAQIAAHDAAVRLLAGAGWRVLPVRHGTTLASVWPLAGSRTAGFASAVRA